MRPARSKITLRHLLTHTSGLAYDFTSVELTRYLSRKGLAFRQPGGRKSDHAVVTTT